MRKNNSAKAKPEQETYELPDCFLAIYAQIKGGKLGVVNMKTCKLLQVFGIEPNDIVIFRPTCRYDEDRLTIWYERKANRFLAGYAFDNFGDISIDEFGTGISRYKKREIELKGEVVGVVKPFAARTAETPEPINEENSVVCSKCGKTGDGSESFLKGMGWKLRGEKLCLQCDLY